MKVGVFTVLYQKIPLEEALDKVKSLGLDAVEIGTGNYPGNSHCNPDELLSSDAKLNAFKKAIADRGLIISALSCHGNNVHPDPKVAKGFHETWRKTVELAGKLGIDTVVTFSGCPGGSPLDRTPNWITCPWPDDFTKALEYQWNEVVIPYWKREAEFAKAHGVTRIAFEMHPGFVVYNPETLMKLRNAVGEAIGANFDPSHLIWQGIDPAVAIRYIGSNGALFHFHAKDTFVDVTNVKRIGVLDAKSYGDIPNRAWVFRTIGYGTSEQAWRDQVSALRTVGYDGVLSIEHEDSMASVDEGFSKAVQLLNRVIFRENAGAAWWF